LAILSVGLFYYAFTYAVYHAVPWQFVATESLVKDITAAGILSYLLPAGLGVIILLGAAIALLNDLPAMILSVSRLVFSWAEDGIFPKKLATVHPRYHSPYLAILVSGSVSSLGILGSHFAGDFFLGIDIMVTSILVNFLLMCLSVAFIRKKNPAIAQEIKLFSNPSVQKTIAWTGSVFLIGFLIIHLSKDLSAEVSAWYFHSTWVWLLVMGLASLLFFARWQKLKKSDPQIIKRFSTLPQD
jgi:amino acid transporter